MKKVLFIIMTLLILMISGCSTNTLNNIKTDANDQLQNIVNKDNEYVLMVKNGHPTDYPNTTYSTSFESFFGSPTWKYFKSDDGQDVVEFTGNCTYQNVEVKARMQFILDINAGTFQAGALSFNDVPQNQLITAALLSKVFEEPASETSVVSNNENSNVTSSNDSTQEIFYGQWVINKLVNYDGIGTYSEDDINKKVIGQQMNFSKEKSSSFGDDISYMASTIKNPTYEKSVISKDEFEVNYGIEFDSLGLEGDSVTVIDVIDSTDNIGCVFFIKDKNTLILYGGGAYFELNKIQK